MGHLVNAYIATCALTMAVAIADAKFRNMIIARMKKEEKVEEVCESSAEYRYRRWVETMNARNKEVK